MGGTLPHNITGVVRELNDSDTGLDVPENAGHITGRRDDLSVVDEATAGEITGVGGELAGTLDTHAVLVPEVVDGTNVVETTAGDKGGGGRVGAGHDPGGAEGDSVDLVGGVGVPDDELSVLGGGDEMALVGGPVHSIDLREMASE